MRIQQLILKRKRHEFGWSLKRAFKQGKYLTLYCTVVG